MKPLIDADVLRYEIGSMGDGDDGPLSFDYVREYLDNRVQDICQAVEATEDPILYITTGENFRHELAVTKGYKANRNKEKPFHFQNLTAYIKNQYEYVEAIGIEADDAMSIDQREDTVICTRDKDLRMVPGWHYGWECGQQREVHLHYVEEDGSIWMEKDKLRGNGLAFFYAQLLMGDQVDNIPGCPGIGPKKTFDALGDLHVDMMFDKVREVYYSKGCDDDMILEQGRLLWMVRELDSEGNPVLWNFPS